MTALVPVVATLIGTSAFWLLMFRPIVRKIEDAMTFEIADHIRKVAKMHVDWGRPSAKDVAAALEKVAGHISDPTFLKDGAK